VLQAPAHATLAILGWQRQPPTAVAINHLGISPSALEALSTTHRPLHAGRVLVQQCIGFCMDPARVHMCVDACHGQLKSTCPSAVSAATASGWPLYSSEQELQPGYSHKWIFGPKWVALLTALRVSVGISTTQAPPRLLCPR
jgi:hypothetical protein